MPTARSRAAASFANNCLLARRLVEQGVRFVQLFDWGWDFHGTNAGEDIRDGLTKKCRHDGQAGRRADQGPEAARAARRDAGHLGRRVRPHAVPRGPHRRRQGPRPRPLPGLLHAVPGRRRHQGRASRTARRDELGFSVAKDKVHVHDLQATILHLLGFDHTKLTYRFQGRDYRLTDVHGKVVKEILA